LLLPTLISILFVTSDARGVANPDTLRRFPPSPAPKATNTAEAQWPGGARFPRAFARAAFGPLPDVGSASASPVPPFVPQGPRGSTGWLPLPAPSLEYHAAIYDASRRRVIAFGGAPYAFYDDYAGYPLSNQVWELSLDGPAVWRELIPIGPEPSPRRWHSAVLDPVRDRLLIFGGGNDFSDPPSFLNDVWALSLTGAPVWTRLEVHGAPPPPRWSQSAIYDEINDAMVIFGGFAGNSRLGDTWSLSLSGAPTWTKLEIPGPTPPARNGHAAAYDPVRNQMVIVSGWDGKELMDDAWALALTGVRTWTQLAATGTRPPSRVAHTCVYDPNEDRMIIFGGIELRTLSPSDTWALALAGTPAWTKLSPANSPPSPRTGHAAIYDAQHHRMIVMGGWGNWEEGMDTWALSLKGPLAWSALIYGGRPSWGRTDHTAVYDSARERMVIFGGWSYAQGNIIGDTWALSLARDRAWTYLDDDIFVGPPPWTYPDGRVGHSAIYDPVRERMLIFGGYDTEGRLTNDVWSLGLSGAPNWSRVETAGEAPSPRFAHRAIYDPAGDRMIVFGGFAAGAMRSDVWALSLAEPPRWTELTPAAPGPAARAAHGLIYDPVGKCMLVHGGTDNQRLYDDTWALSLDAQPAWSQIRAAAPPAVLRMYHSAVYDPDGQRMVIWGGSHHGVDLNDTWALSLAGQPAWTEVLSANEAPEPRDGHSAVYDPQGRDMIIFGGSFDFNDTWALSLGRQRGRVEVAAELAEAVGTQWPNMREPRPNPSPGETDVEFTLPQSSQVALSVYDAAGRSVKRLAEGVYTPGAHGVRWDGRDAAGHPAPTGLYFLRLEAGGKAITRKAVIAR
jgi:hypothetical protein